MATDARTTCRRSSMTPSVSSAKSTGVSGKTPDRRIPFAFEHGSASSGFGGRRWVLSARSCSIRPSVHPAVSGGHGGNRTQAVRRPLRRKDRFDTPEAFAERLCEIPVFARMRPGAIDLFARATLRRAPDGEGYELSCPRECEARINEFIFVWSMMWTWAASLSRKGYRGRPYRTEFVHAEHGFEPTHPCRLRFRAGDVSFSPVRGAERCAAMTLAFLEGCGLI